MTVGKHTIGDPHLLASGRCACYAPLHLHFCTFICCPSILHYSVYVRLGVQCFTYPVHPVGRKHPPLESGE